MEEMKNKKCNEEQIAYMQIIEGAIDRIGSNSAVLKGFAAAVLTGISALAAITEISGSVLLISLLPVLLFGYLDAKYLQVEKKFRVLYEQVRLSKKEIDFSMAIKFPKKVLKAGNATLWSAICSWSVWPFYGLLLFTGLILVLLKLKGCV